MTDIDVAPPFTVRMVAGRMGAEVQGLVLSGDLDPAVVAALRRELLEKKVLCFRGHGHVDDAELVRIGSLFGTVTYGSAPRRFTEADPIRKVDATDPGHLRANVWHTDHLFVDRPPSIAILRAVETPRDGGDTMWADTGNAYRMLPASLRSLAEQLKVLHANEFDYDQLDLDAEGVTNTAVTDSIARMQTYAAIQPVIHVHPETGERCFLLGRHARHIVGLTAAESAAIIRLYQDRITRPENTARWSWQPGDIVMWDNRSTQHYAVDDWGHQRRILHRLSIAGEVPVGIDGQPARVVRGDPSAYYTAAGADRS
jgi:taurine dioxygenase